MANTSTPAGGSIAAPVFIITAGFVMVYSALKGVSVTDIFAGSLGAKLDPKGGYTPPPFSGSGVTPDAQDAADASQGAGPFKGPNARTLAYCDGVLRTRFHLRRGSTCRSPAHNAAVGGSPTSFHVQCRAADYTGTVANRVAAAHWLKDNFPILEVFCDQAGMSAPGFDHSDHLHMGG